MAFDERYAAFSRPWNKSPDAICAYVMPLNTLSFFDKGDVDVELYVYVYVSRAQTYIPSRPQRRTKILWSDIVSARALHASLRALIVFKFAGSRNFEIPGLSVGVGRADRDMCFERRAERSESV